MNQREKILSIIVGAVIVVVAGNFLFKTIFLGPLNEVNEKIILKEKEIEKKKRLLDSKNRLIREWRSVGRQALSDDPEKANLILRERITSLITAAGLRDVSNTPVSISPTKAGGVNLYTPVAVFLTGKGTLAQFVNFLEMLYREPYIVKVKGFTLHPEEKGELMSFSNFRIETIVPAKAVLPKDILLTTRPVVTATQPALKTGLISQYAMIPDRNIFKFHETLPPTTPGRLTTQIPGRNDNSMTITGPVDPNGRPGDVVGTVAIGKIMGAYIRNQTGVVLYKVEDKLNNGMNLAYVHPLGIVLRDPLGRTVYVEIGGNIDQTAPLNPKAIPELYEAWKSQTGR